MSAMIHIAGVYVQLGPLLRQRCAWCGAVLIDYNLDNMAMAGESTTPATWPPGALIAVDEGLSYVVEHRDGEQLPEGSCGKLDPAVTA